MKLQKQTVAVTFLVLVVEAQSGLIDNFYGKVKNTTSGLRQDVRNVWSYSKDLVGLENNDVKTDTRTEEERRGLIGGMVHNTREKVHSIRTYFWNTDEASSDKGLVGNVLNRVKNCLSKGKGLLLGDDEHATSQTTPAPSEKTKIIRDTLNKLFFRNGTRQVNGKAFQEAIDNLRKKLREIRDNMTSTASNPVHHGEGMIDVRALIDNDPVLSSKDSNAGVANDIYDTVDDSLNLIGDHTVGTYRTVKDNLDQTADTNINAITHNVDKAAHMHNTMKNNVNQGVDAFTNGIDNGLNKLKIKASVVPKQNELLDNTYNNFNEDVRYISDPVKKSVEDMKKLSYS